MGQRRVTIKDIAAEIGISRMTVSNALRGVGRVGSRTRQRVLRAAERMGYRPNHLSRALKGGKSMAIGVVTHTSSVQVHTYRLVAIEMAAHQKHYAVLTESVARGGGLDPFIRAIRNLLDRHADGLIVNVSPALAEHEDLFEFLRSIAVPAVYLDGYEVVPSDVPNRVVCRRMPAYQEMARHLRELGHREAAYVCTRGDLASVYKVGPCREAFAREGISCSTDQNWILDHREETEECVAACRVVSRMIESGALCSALVFGNDTIALAGLSAICQAGFDVPGDVSVVGYDDVPHAEFAQPPLTTVHQPRHEMGEAAFAMLGRMMEERDWEPRPVRFDCELVLRRSTGPAKRTS